MLRIAMLAIAVLSVSTAVAAEQGGRPRRDATKHEAKKPNPCAAQGPGFTMLPGTTTCVRVGGAVFGDFGAGRGAAPNLGVK